MTNQPELPMSTPAPADPKLDKIVQSPPEAPVAGLMFHHQDDGGDGLLHLAGGDKCPCGAPHVGSTKVIPFDDQGVEIAPPDSFCARARVELGYSARVTEVPATEPTATAAPTPEPPKSQAIEVQQPKRDPVPFHPRDTGEMMRYATFLANSQLIPRALQRNPSDVLVVLLKGQDLGLTPMQSISGINVIDGKAEVGALLMVSMIIRSGLAEYWQLIESDETKATYETKRRGNPSPTRFTYTVDEARSAGLLDKGRDAQAKAKQPWNTQRRTMLRRRCQSMLAREVYPDICAGLYDHDELQEIRELSFGLIRAEADAKRAGFTVVDDPETLPGWMAAGSTDAGPGTIVPVDVDRPADPLKARLAARAAAAAKPAEPETP